MTFEEILPRLKRGEKIIRRGFTGGENYIVISGKQTWQNENLLPFFLINVKGEGFAIYTPTVCDLLADDWEVVKESV